MKPGRAQGSRHSHRGDPAVDLLRRRPRNPNISVLVTGVKEQRGVMRRPPLGTWLASAHDVESEVRIHTAVTKTGVPTPRAIALTGDPAVTDAPLMLIEHVDRVEALAAIHEVDLDAVGIADLASPKPYAVRQLGRWRAQREASRTGRAGGRARGRASGYRPVSTGGTNAAHGDFHPRNVAADRASGHPRAILDWELATLGKSLAVSEGSCLLALTDG